MQIPGIVLAAGMSTRMGAFKPLMALGEELLVRRVVGSLRDSGVIEPLMVVAGHRGAEVETALAGMGVTVVINEDYAEGEMLSSVRAGIEALPAGARGFLLAFADQPAVLPGTVRALVQRYGEEMEAGHKVPLVLPVYGGKRGHPVVVSCKLVPEIRALPRQETLKAVVHRHTARAILVSVDDPEVLEDLDTPEDFARAEERMRGRGETI